MPEHAPALLDTQRRFAGLIRSTGPTDLPDLLQGDAARRTAGLTAYRRNALLNAQHALCLAYPVLAQVVGEEFMRALGRDYWQAHPSHSGDLNDYGADLAERLAGPAEKIGRPWLVELARLEWAVHIASRAVDLAPQPLAALQACAPEQLPGLRLALHPATCLLASPWPLASLWRQHQPDYQGALDLDHGGPEIAWVARSAWRVDLRALGAAEAAFWQAAQAGHTLTDMIEQALEHDPGFDPAASLQQAFTQGLIVSLH